MRLGRRGTGVLKSVHLAFTGLWIGGVVALFPLALGVDVADPTAARTTYLHLRAIAWNVIGWGGIGSLFTGIALGVLTPWGLFRHGWIVAKLGLTVYGIAFGMFFVERHMLAGLALLESAAGASGAFALHHQRFTFGLFAQTATFAAIILIAVLKPRLGRTDRDHLGSSVQTLPGQPVFGRARR